MPRRSDLAVHTFSVFVRSTLLLLIVLISNTAHGYDCGDSKDCSLEQLANYLDRIKDRFETPDYKYDQIYAEGDNTIVFVQRILHAMNKSERSYVKIKGANKKAVVIDICSKPDIQFMLNQGLFLKYTISDINQHPINEFTIKSSDC